MLLRSRRTKRSGIIREMALVMSRPSVVPRYAVTVGSLQGGTVIGKTHEERGKLHLEFYTLTLCRAENKTKLINRVRCYSPYFIGIRSLCADLRFALSIFSLTSSGISPPRRYLSTSEYLMPSSDSSVCP